MRRLMTWTAFVLIGGFLLPPLAIADSATIDRRSDKSAPSNYNVAFAARGDSDTGHAFVILYAEDEKARASVDVAFGLYPLEASKWLIGPVPGKIFQEALADRKKIAHRLDVRVDEKVYRKLREHIEEERKKFDSKEKEYGLLWRDCVGFTRECAEVTGLEVPARILDLGPEAAVRALIRANSSD